MQGIVLAPHQKPCPEETGGLSQKLGEILLPGFLTRPQVGWWMVDGVKDTYRGAPGAAGCGRCHPCHPLYALLSKLPAHRTLRGVSPGRTSRAPVSAEGHRQL